VRVLYYTHPAFLEPALCLVRELSRRVEVHLVMELSPAAWQTAGFDVSTRPLSAGLHPGDDVLRDAFPAGVRAYWQSAASFHVVVHPQRRSLHPRSWQISRDVLRFAARAGVDVLHVDDVDVSPRLALALPGSTHPPIVMSVHDPEPHSGERNWRKQLARGIAYPRTARFILYNGAMRETFAARHRIPPASIRVARLGSYDIVREWSSSDVERSRPTVLFFGRLSRYKGLDVFYDAATRIARRVPGITFVVAGRAVEGYTPPAPPDLEGAGTIDLRDRYVSNAEAASLFAQATVVVCPYRDATQSGVVLTAFGFGVPVVATNTGGLPEYVVPDRTGLLVPAGDAEALADSVCRILQDEAYRARLCATIVAARGDVLGWQQTADQVVAAYEAARSNPSSDT
jgi:glycosyltransferase involved in cell wall biosynthesis